MYCCDSEYDLENLLYTSFNMLKKSLIFRVDTILV